MPAEMPASGVWAKRYGSVRIACFAFIASTYQGRMRASKLVVVVRAGP